MSDHGPPPPPACISRDEHSAADQARRHLASKSGFPRFLSLPNLRRSPLPQRKSKGQSNEPASLITLDSTSLNTSEEYTDKYEWAIVYENQRGLTLFSIPYYSRMSLLPSDPPPFTIPNASSDRSEQLSSLTDYQLPDGTWKWVSKCWMIDMRSDSGEVQHDGFEYNTLFRTHNWSAEVGPCSVGGWVRRRRWIRLMMRPAKHKHIRHGDIPDGQSSPSVSTSPGFAGWHRHSVNSSFPPSIMSPDSELLDNLSGVDDIWTQDDVEGNWSKCRILMKSLGRDGRKLELWKTWLSHYHPDHQHAYLTVDSPGKARQKQWTEDSTPMPSESGDDNGSTNFSERLRIPPKEYLIPVLRTHGSALLQSFVYPDSRAKFIMMLGLAGLLPELNVGLGMGLGASEMDFWSYVNGLVDQFPVLGSRDDKSSQQTP
ncbi:hypothetical protein FPV67DRAFT_1465844 [Lyophyllum atratum]|nr:hypothetical protein FPV67DRAFT_1465844 [Lyophyllum atratum]